jgi:hypothetical protein
MKQKTADDVYVTFLKALAADLPNLLQTKALQLTIENSSLKVIPNAYLTQ